MIDYVESHREEFGVEPICRTLSAAGVRLATEHRLRGRFRAPSARAARDAGLAVQIARVHPENFGVYGARKVWRRLRRDSSWWRGARWSG